MENEYNPVSFRGYHEKKLESDPEYKRDYEELEPRYSLIKAMVKARDESGMTQEEIASKMGTSAPALSRMLSGSQLPSWGSISKFAKALGKEPIIAFVDSS